MSRSAPDRCCGHGPLALPPVGPFAFAGQQDGAEARTVVLVVVVVAKIWVHTECCRPHLHLHRQRSRLQQRPTTASTTRLGSLERESRKCGAVRGRSLRLSRGKARQRATRNRAVAFGPAEAPTGTTDGRVWDLFAIESNNPSRHPERACAPGNVQKRGVRPSRRGEMRIVVDPASRAALLWAARLRSQSPASKQGRPVQTVPRPAASWDADVDHARSLAFSPLKMRRREPGASEAKACAESPDRAEVRYHRAPACAWGDDDDDDDEVPCLSFLTVPPQAA
ncbi:uncharacterized protein PSFLO_02014 [Pseudozyma flocculosa]|uniref:Uncharacterized protein n=1 Tax=Pseudozyma flocculosa TaxID=84751 RepID=A0A5C3EWB3_9BASI|nr:uncharacterized protein PSFLO_02014 [Pseudozyma flocculosa]